MNRLTIWLLLALALSTFAGAAPLITLDGVSNLEEPAHGVVSDSFLQLDLEVPFAPTPFPSSGSKYLCYELLATNMIPKEYKLSKLEVLNAENGDVVYSLIGKELKAFTRLSGGYIPDAKKEGSLAIPGGQRAIVMLFFGFKDGAEVPRELAHRLTFDMGDGERLFEWETRLRVQDQRPTVFGPPVLGGPWFCDGAPQATSYHRKTVLSINGVSRVSQRYAIDLELLTTEGKTFRGDRALNTSYPAYGQQIYSVSDGKVVKKIDGLVDNTPPNVPEMVDPEHVGGNGIIVEIEEGKRYVVYGHLQPGSITVNEGDQVGRGQPIGKIGNSGNSFEPHLHIQLCDRPSFLGAQGLPFVFESYKLVRQKSSRDKRDELPLLNQVVEFPERI